MNELYFRTDLYQILLLTTIVDVLVKNLIKYQNIIYIVVKA